MLRRNRHHLQGYDMTEGKGTGNGGGAPVEDLMRYDLLVETALRHVVRLALTRVQREGLPGDHHFYIAFDTRHPALKISDRLREKYPEEMTIVLQHQFWDLKVLPDRFEVGLSFGGVPEKLEIPFDAITGFYDPHVQFALQFRQPTEEEMALMEGMEGEVSSSSPVTGEAALEEAAGEQEAASDADAADKAKGTEEKVISLDAFRKKT